MFDTDMGPGEKANLVVSILSLGGAVVAFSLALVQYRRSEKWKRAEFIANEVKQFESDPAVQNALLMIDWGTREINLFLRSDPKEDDLLEITRDVQWRALLPHPLKEKYHDEYKALDFPQKGKGDKDRKKRNFTLVEARIRDAYDVFLTKFGRFSCFIESKLISPEELKPFIIYWVDAMTENKHPEKDTAWRYALLTYINYYEYYGVISLLKSYGKDVSPEGRIYSELRSSMQDPASLAERLFETIRPGKSNPAADG